jgi:hypothetical protein
VCNSQKTAKWVVGEAGDTLNCRVDNIQLGGMKEETMATEGHKRSQGKDHQKKIKEKMDKELEEIRVETDRLALKMQQESQVHWRYEWPMK